MRLAIGTFGGLSALPLLVAQEIGFFADAGLAVSRQVTTDSARLRADLQGGALDIIHLAPDNIIAWAQADATPARAWLAGSGGPISLVAHKAANVAALRGSRIAVDSPHSGFVTILRRLLQAADVDPGDVELVPHGSTRMRFQALQKATVEATMLTLPWTTLASRTGAAVLADHTSVAPGLLTSCAASLADWLEQDPGRASRYADTIDAAVAWMHRPGNRARTEQLLASDMELDTDLAAGMLDTMLDERLGWPHKARLLGHELTPNWRLRAEAVAEPPEPPSAYVHVLPGA